MAISTIVHRPRFLNRLLVCLAIFVSLYSSLEACAQSVVKVGIEQVPDSFDPFRSYTGAEAAFFELFFDSLYRLSPDSSKMMPWLAADFPTVLTVGDKIHLSIPLRRGIRWHDGKAFLAEDVLYTLSEVYLNPIHPLSSLWCEVITSLGMRDDYEFFLIVNREKAGYLLKIFSLPIYPSSFAEHGPVGVQKIIGTGPFMFNDKLGDSYLTVRRNWWYHANGWTIDDGIVGPHVSGILFKQVNDKDAEEAFRRGDIDLFLGRMATDALAKGAMNFTDRIRLLVFNLRQSPGDDLAFRRAVGAMAAELLTGLVQQTGRGPIPLSFPKESARSILKHGGYTWDNDGALIGPGGEAVGNLKLVIMTENEESLRYVFALGLIKELEELGVKVDVRQGDIAALIEPVFCSYDYDLLIYGWKIQQGFPMHLVELLYSGTIGQFGPNVSGFEQERYDYLVKMLLASFELANVYDIQAELERVWQEELPLLPLFYAGDGVAYSVNSKVARYFNDGGGFWSFAGLHFVP